MLNFRIWSSIRISIKRYQILQHRNDRVGINKQKLGQCWLTVFSTSITAIFYVHMAKSVSLVCHRWLIHHELRRYYVNHTLCNSWCKFMFMFAANMNSLHEWMGAWNELLWRYLDMWNAVYWVYNLSKMLTTLYDWGMIDHSGTTGNIWRQLG